MVASRESVDYFERDGQGGLIINNLHDSWDLCQASKFRGSKPALAGDDFVGDRVQS